MKLIPRFLCLAIIAASLHQSINAEEPSLREQFKTAVDAYQKDSTPTNALKVIEIFKQLEPPPAVPEEAREPFVMGRRTVPEASQQGETLAPSAEPPTDLAPLTAISYPESRMRSVTIGNESGTLLC